MMGKERGSGEERGKVGNERSNNRGDASAHLSDHLRCSAEVNLIAPLAAHVLASAFVFASIKSVFARLLAYFLSPVYMCVCEGLRFPSSLWVSGRRSLTIAYLFRAF